MVSETKTKELRVPLKIKKGKGRKEDLRRIKKGKEGITTEEREAYQHQGPSGVVLPGQDPNIRGREKEG